MPPFVSEKMKSWQLIPCVTCGKEACIETRDPDEANRLMRLNGFKRVLLGERWVWFCARCK